MKYKITVAIAACVLILIGAYFVTQNIRHGVSHISDDDNDRDESSFNEQEYAAAVISALSTPKIIYEVSSSTPQFVLLSFDGSKSVEMLDETLDFEQKMIGEGKPLHFTYFINPAYFLTNSNATLYQPPAHHARGSSAIGFSNHLSDIPLRMKEFNKAFTERNEIGSHSVGHFDGSTWSYDEWKQEFVSFDTIISNVQQNNQQVQIESPLFLSSIHGFRAPQLGVNANLYAVLSDFHFTYDASGMNMTNSWPYQDTRKLWHIPLGTVFLGNNRHPVLSMDYNLWTRQSNAQEKATHGTALWNTYYNEVEESYMNYFNSNYMGNRAPIVIANHFSKWNDGVYWEAMKQFAENVCGLPNVKCVTFQELVNYLDSTGVPPIRHS